MSETPKEKYVAPDNFCAACRARGKTWDGSDAKCAFVTGKFSQDNWNCATDGLIRQIAPNLWRDMAPNPYLYHIREDGQNHMLIHVGHLDLKTDALSLWVSWYKNRGQTEAMWLLSEYGAPVPPTEDDVIRIAAAFQLPSVAN